MSEYMIPIPSRVYNAAVDGHVAGADQIIDDKTGLTLDKVAGGALEEKEYISSSNNGMGRVVLRKNLVEGINTLTQNMINKSNTIYIIQYDFTLGEDITIPANCVLKFDGGKFIGAGTNKDTVTLNNTLLIGNPYFDAIVFDGTIKNDTILASWCSNENTILSAIKLISENNKKFIFTKGEYHLHNTVFLYGGGSIFGEKDAKIYLYNDTDNGIYCGFICGIKEYAATSIDKISTWTGKINGLNLYPKSGMFNMIICIYNASHAEVSDCLFDGSYSLNAIVSNKYLSGVNNAELSTYPYRDFIYILRNTIICDTSDHARAARGGESPEALSIADSGTNIFIEKNKIFGALDDLAVHNCQGVTIRDNYFNTYDARILANSCKNVLIDNNTIEVDGNVTGSGGGSWCLSVGIEYSDVPSENIIISNNIIRAINGGTINYGCRISSGKNIKILSNTWLIPNASIFVDASDGLAPSGTTDENKFADYIFIENNTVPIINFAEPSGQTWSQKRTLIVRGNRVQSLYAYSNKAIVTNNNFYEDGEFYDDGHIIPRREAYKFDFDDCLEFEFDTSKLSDGWNEIPFVYNQVKTPLTKLSDYQYIIEKRIAPKENITMYVPSGPDTHFQVILEKDSKSVTYDGIIGVISWNSVGIKLPLLECNTKIKLRYQKPSGNNNGIVHGAIYFWYT